MTDHEHRSDGTRVVRTREVEVAPGAEREGPRHTNGFVAAWARAVRARRGFTGAAEALPPATGAPPRTIATAPAPPASVPTGAGSPWLRRR